MTTMPTQHERTDMAFREIAASIAKRGYGSFTLRLEILKPNNFVTACMEFHDASVGNSRQEILDYSEAILVSFTCHIDMWHDFARRLISGQLELNGTQIPATFSYASRQEEMYLREGADAPRECFQFTHSSQDNLYSPKPLLGIGLRPYANLADASARFVHQLPVAHSQITYEKCFVIALPRSAEIALAEWLPGELRVRLVHDRLTGYQFDIFFWEPQRVSAFKSIPDPQQEISVPVPPGTTTVAGHLLTPASEIAHSFVLHAPYTFVGAGESSLSYEQQVRADILAGESENREMKAFFNPDQNKEMRDRVLDSAIAFANTSGGCIYVGVEDHGELSGNSKLVRAMRAGATPEECARELSAKLRRYIIENTRPVVEVCPLEVKIGTEWVVRLSIQQSQQIISTHANQIFIRSGASNRNPEPAWFAGRGANAVGLVHY